MYTSRDPEPLGPDSLTWRYFGDWRGLLCALWAGSMQNMHPGLGAGVEQHSHFFDERWERLFRSLYPIGGVVYDGPRAAETAREVRRYHDAISGVDDQGRRYHALDPDTFYWAHATFFMNAVLTAEHFAGGLSTADKRRMFDEHVQWYAMYGLSMRPVPATWEDFQTYWDRMCREVLEVNRATREVLDITDLARPSTVGWMPLPMWRLVRVPVARGFVWLTTGLYDPSVRTLLGLHWRRRDRVLFAAVTRTITAVFRLVPFDRRYHPRARAGWLRVRGEWPADRRGPASPERWRARHVGAFREDDTTRDRAPAR
ncbi:oxygenase MpaB family protein [Mumia zhuanghuii]|uniref:DUF2236 domain-containing protein n=1 Tax=Mumia zhuanghuii TaxID=2585211 RepID=A0A5C4M5E9_9ACTN|nr:oxygenase MpaB family protein [Mumia zhuanghuii]TNC27967.1 DUF2236 domain-containing protein [Mumia zhuanghuii]TNC46088.1 DUF2236 domain-containing protein [Mumia zhuanghuii]